MTEKILIDRAVVEQALEALFMYKPMVTGVTFQHGLDAMQALRAALEQPQPLPSTVWRFVPTTMTNAMVAVDKELRHAVPWIRWEAILAAAPQPPRQPKRQPLTDGEILMALDAADIPDLPRDFKDVDIDIARAIERAHGIGE